MEEINETIELFEEILKRLKDTRQKVKEETKWQHKIEQNILQMESDIAEIKKAVVG